MKILMKGNEAIAESAIKAGCKAFFGYPITPQNEIPEYLSRRMEEENLVFVQAESEVAAINMVYGAAAAGVRVMTSSSSPGIALKQEGISYLCGADLPCLIVSVSRAGPGLGGILPAQGDYFQATRGGGNGDYFMPVYAPASVQEASDLVFKAFDTADKYRTPVMILADGMLGQMMEPVEITKNSPLPADKPWAADGTGGIRERNVISSLSLSSTKLEEGIQRRFALYDKIKQNESLAEVTLQEGDQVAVVAYGIPARIVLNAIDELKKEGVSAGLIRPVTPLFAKSVGNHLKFTYPHCIVLNKITS